MTVKHGTNGEFMAASWLLEELGLAAGPYDIQMVAQVIAYAARDSGADCETVCKNLLTVARAAVADGELINTFWFKDRKWLQRKARPPAKPEEPPMDEAEATRVRNRIERKQYDAWLEKCARYGDAWKAANPWKARIPDEATAEQG